MDGLREALSAWTRRREADDAAEAAAGLLACAEEHLASPSSDPADAALWQEYLGATGSPDFLERLADAPARGRWAESTFRAIRRSGYTLRSMLQQRVAAHPDRVLFDDARETVARTWTYAQVARHLQSVAGVFLDSLEPHPGAAGPAPRVAILAENGIDVACADLACLLYGIFVTPLNVHLEAETVRWICERLDITLVVTDSDERIALLAEVQAGLGRPLKVFRTGARAAAATVRGLEVVPLRPECARIDSAAVATRLAARRIDLMAPATVMFTSGSTGRPKGIVFNQYNLVAKRFARAAALPSVGRDEVLLCYLPLFHTFGRYLELLGTLYWGGTYVFAGSPTAEGLLAEVVRVRPTGLISVPVRWTQIREECLERMEGEGEPAAEAAAFRAVVGDRLRWGLSAAGYLDPLVFRFFQRNGVDLCSGFGMTEATGGITMTPPRAYLDGTVGIPLPGMRIRFGAQQELQIAGCYVARYLDEEGAPGALPYLDPDEQHWLPTGDLFREHEGGYLEIVDRIKDIYKNSRGQTIAPQRVEQRFAEVPGIRRTFLAGDHRDYNVLLIVPNREDALLATLSAEGVHHYLGQIVASVNESLAPYERVVRFALLDRDFEAERGELTGKGSLRRKTIAEHFQHEIEQLYLSNHVDLALDGLRVRIPRWFFRDLAVLDDDIVGGGGQLRNQRTGAVLAVEPAADGWLKVGDLLYRVEGRLLDLGVFARQPRLWVGNPALVAFSPCKPGWELPLHGVSGQVRLPAEGPAAVHAKGAIRDDRLRELHEAIVPALFGTEEASRGAIERLAGVLARADERIASVVRRRLEALAFRPEEEVRALAYRVLLLDEPQAGYENVFPTFIESGMNYLNEASIAAIAQSRGGERRLQRLRQRLYSYRTQLEWPGPPMRRAQFTRALRMLAGFARNDPESFPAVEAELAAWALFREDPGLARTAATILEQLGAWREAREAARVPAEPAEPPTDKVVFDFGIPPAQRDWLRRMLFDPTFMARALARAFGEDGFSWTKVARDGAWVSSVLSHPRLHLYRLGINFLDGKHFDLLLVTGNQLRHRSAVGDTVLWLIALSDHAFDPPTLPRFGAWRKDLGAIALRFVNDLTAWERIRELSREVDRPEGPARQWPWRRLYVRAMATFFRAWEHSGYRIVPGALTPANVAVPDPDFHESSRILSLAGWRPYQSPAAFVGMLFRNFYRQTEAFHPHSRELLQVGWIFDACLEGVGAATAARFLDELAAELEAAPATAESRMLLHGLAEHRAGLEARPHVPLPVSCAIHRYQEWERLNPTASHEAREEAVLQMIRLYRLERFDDAYRFFVYQHTYFALAGPGVGRVFDRLVARRLGRPALAPGQLEELSELQGLMVDGPDRDVFSRMVFPQAQKAQQLEILEVCKLDDRRVLVRSSIRDEAGAVYDVREPITPVEVGQLYRLILDVDYPMRISADDRHLVIADPQERIVGGLFYRWQESGGVYIDGIVVAAGQRHQGLGGQLLEDFCVRMAAQGALSAKTTFFHGRLFTKHGFTVNQRSGGLVRFLGAEAGCAPAGP